MNRTTFRGGVHPFEGKELARDIPFQELLPEGELVFHLNQHIGKPAKPVVKRGALVKAGQIIAEADGFVSANVVSSVSGKVKAIENRKNVLGTTDMSIVITNDGQYTLADGIGTEVDPDTLTNQEIIDKVKAAGVIGMGGAGFPTHVKLMPKDPAGIKYFIANGAECEPYLTCDDQLMRTRADEIVEGIKICLKLFPNAQGYIAVEDNKPEAIAALEKACAGESKISVYKLQCKYPQGGERSIMAAIAGKHINVKMLPADVGCIIDNVYTVLAIYRAVCKSEPVMERTFTVSGDGVQNPGNFIVKVGTCLNELLNAAGGFKEGTEPKKLIIGGPMMGFAMSDLEAAVCKNNNGLTVFIEDPVETAAAQMTACLRCGRCNQVCPLGLTPQMMAVAAQKKNYDRYENKLYGLECIGCGTCTYICPAKRPLMQLFKQTKAEIMAAKRKK